MKNILIKSILFFAFFLIGNQVDAQKLVMENEEISYDSQLRSAVKVTIAPDKKEVRKDWEDYIEDNYGTKVKGNGWLRKKDVLSAKGVFIPSISEKQIDLYAEVMDKDHGSQVYVFASFGYDMHITAEAFPKEYRALETLTLDFMDNILTDYYKDQVEDSKELVSEIQEKRKDMEENLSENKEEIVELKEDNSELKREIKSKLIELEKAIAALEEDEANFKMIKNQLTNENYSGVEMFVMEKSKTTYDDKMRTAVIVFMEPERKKVRDAWEDFLEDDYDTKTKGNGLIGKDDVIRAKEANIADISNKTIDLYAEVLDKDQGSELKVFASFGYDVHITPEKFPNEFTALENFTLKFINEFLMDYYEDEVKEAQDLVDDLQDDKNDMQKKLSENKEDIVDLNEDNVELKEDMTAKGVEMEKAANTLEVEKEKQKQLNKKINSEKKNIKKKDN